MLIIFYPTRIYKSVEVDLLMGSTGTMFALNLVNHSYSFQSEFAILGKHIHSIHTLKDELQALLMAGCNVGTNSHYAPIHCRQASRLFTSLTFPYVCSSSSIVVFRNENCFDTASKQPTLCSSMCAEYFVFPHNV